TPGSTPLGPGEYAFTCGLVRSVLLSTLSPSRRHALLTTMARALADVPDVPDVPDDGTRTKTEHDPGPVTEAAPRLGMDHPLPGGRYWQVRLTGRSVKPAPSSSAPEHACGPELEVREARAGPVSTDERHGRAEALGAAITGALSA
ncbi:hypothetical protein, partial [Streptomyces sp. NPDC060022]|uniref:hypothetical protein n=1 Tax=Streptomyces sp. NPDC060022 TaxID=3347039 RepID=UPI0036A13040